MAASEPLNPEIIGRAIDQAPLTRPLKFIAGVAAAGYFFDSFDIVILSYALPSIAKEFSLAPQQIGLIGSAGLAGMGIGSWIWGWIADRWGRRLVFAGTVLMFSLFTGVTGLAMTVGFLLGARFLTGLGLGGIRKRVRMLGGSIAWLQNTPAGVRCEVSVPLAVPAMPAEPRPPGAAEG